MLLRIKDELKKNYYDANFRGMDLDARFATASTKIKEAASVGQILGIIAQVLLELDDSHTFFLPPQHQTRVDYGWTMQMIGEHCFVSSVDKGSDAEAKGVKIGDEVIQRRGYVLRSVVARRHARSTRSRQAVRLSTDAVSIVGRLAVPSSHYHHAVAGGSALAEVKAAFLKIPVQQFFQKTFVSKRG